MDLALWVLELQSPLSCRAVDLRVSAAGADPQPHRCSLMFLDRLCSASTSRDQAHCGGGQEKWQGWSLLRNQQAERPEESWWHDAKVQNYQRLRKATWL